MKRTFRNECMKRSFKQLRTWCAVLLLGCPAVWQAGAATSNAVSPLFTVDLQTGGIALAGRVTLAGQSTSSSGVGRFRFCECFLEQWQYAGGEQSGIW